MIQYDSMRVAPGLFLLVSATCPQVFGAESPSLLAVYWQPPGAVAPGPGIRAAFGRAMEARRATVIDDATPISVAVSLVPDLNAAIQEYNAFRFSEAAQRLNELARLADARGGADL